MTNKKPVFSKDIENKKMKVVKEFDADIKDVWNAWTKSELLDQWWAPKPYKAETKSMNFSVGGTWIYAMVGPDGSKQWCRADYTNVEKEKSFSGQDAFCDEDGKKNTEMPSTHWLVKFIKHGEGTKVEIELTYATKEDLEAILNMGFEQGFTMGLGNLDELLAK